MPPAVRILREGARVPEQSSPNASGWDLFSCEDCVAPPGAAGSVSTGIALEIAPSFTGLVLGRHRWAKHGLFVNPGVLSPEDALDEVVVWFRNVGNSPLHVRRGDKVAQVVFVSHVKFGSFAVAEAFAGGAL